MISAFFLVLLIQTAAPPISERQRQDLLLQFSEIRETFNSERQAQAIRPLVALATRIEELPYRGDRELRIMLARVYGYLAHAEFNEGNFGATEVPLKRALHANASFRLDESETPRRLLEEFAAIRATTVGTLRLSVGPGVSSLTLDGLKFEPREQEIELPANNYAIQFRQGGNDGTVVVRVTAGRTTVARVPHGSSVSYVDDTPVTPVSRPWRFSLPQRLFLRADGPFFVYSPPKDFFYRQSVYSRFTEFPTSFTSKAKFGDSEFGGTVRLVGPFGLAATYSRYKDQHTAEATAAVPSPGNNTTRPAATSFAIGSRMEWWHYEIAAIGFSDVLTAQASLGFSKGRERTDHITRFQVQETGRDPIISPLIETREWESKGLTGAIDVAYFPFKIIGLGANIRYLYADIDFQEVTSFRPAHRLFLAAGARLRF